MAAEALTLPPDLLATWVRTLRATLDWSQEALAEAAGINIRTVQRVENGEPANKTTRRCLARGLGYDNHDIFDDPSFADNVRGVLDTAQKANGQITREAIEKQFPDHVRVKVSPVSGGPELARFVDQAGATLLHCDDVVPRSAQEIAAGMFDLVRDLVDVWDDISFSERLTQADELGRLQKEIEGFGLRLYSGFRRIKIVGEYWADQTPHSLTIGYLTILPKGRQIEQMMVPKRLT